MTYRVLKKIKSEFFINRFFIVLTDYYKKALWQTILSFERGQHYYHYLYYLYRFTPSHLVKKVEDQGYELLVVIDLTNTFRYYNGTQVGVEFNLQT